MPGRSYTVTQIVGTSEESIDHAIRNAVQVASKTLHHLGWIEVVESRGMVGENGAVQFQVVLKVGFRYDKSWPWEETRPPDRPRR